MHPYKIIHGAVIGFFYVAREKTSRKLAVAFVIQNTLATNTFAGARLITTIAIYKILFLIQAGFHYLLSFLTPLTFSLSSSAGKMRHSQQ